LAATGALFGAPPLPGALFAVAFLTTCLLATGFLVAVAFLAGTAFLAAGA